MSEKEGVILYPKNSLSSSKTKNDLDIYKKYVDIKFNEKKFFFTAKKCVIKNIKNDGDKTYLWLKITDERFIRMCQNIDRFLIIQGSNNSLSWFDEEFTTEDTSEILKPILDSVCRYDKTMIYNLACTNNELYKNSEEFNKDCLLYEKDNIINVSFLFDKINIGMYRFKCDVSIEKIIYIGPWSVNKHNKTSSDFQTYIMTLLLCNNRMKNPLNSDILIYILEFFQTF